ncbi:MAG: hypothetical protein AB8B55_20110 [Mariniblastus sp.]
MFLSKTKFNLLALIATIGCFVGFFSCNFSTVLAQESSQRIVNPYAKYSQPEQQPAVKHTIPSNVIPANARSTQAGTIGTVQSNPGTRTEKVHVVENSNRFESYFDIANKKIPAAQAIHEKQLRESTPLYGQIELATYQDDNSQSTDSATDENSFIFEVQEKDTNVPILLDDKSRTQADSDLVGEVERLKRMVELQQEQLDTVFGMTDRISKEVMSEPVQPQIVERPLTAENIAGIQRMEQRLNSRLNELAMINQGSLQQLHADNNQLKNNLVQYMPNNLRELFSHSRPLQSPFTIFNTLSIDAVDFQDTNRNFQSPVWQPIFLMDYKDQFQIEINPLIESDRIELLTAQVNWFIDDNTTIVMGRFASPIGFFNERLRTPWVFKTPDRPLMFEQVYPSLLSFRGAQARHSRYIGNSPIKLEFASLVANGFSSGAATATEFDFANLNSFRQFNDINDDLAYGGRIGFSNPIQGWTIGVSGLINSAYDASGNEDLTLWDVDMNYHRGNIDLRFEYAKVNQQSPFGEIDREGLYAQAAYRDRNSTHPLFSRLEGVFRFGMVDFDGIDLATTGTNFGGRELTPVNRNRYTVGLNNYVTPSFILKVAYEVNDERDPAFEVDDNGIIAQAVIGF